MKKIFLFIFALASFSIFFNYKKIDANIYNLLHIQHAEIFHSLQEGLAHQVIFISTNKDLITLLLSLNQKFQVFSSFQDGIHLNQDVTDHLANLKLATFGAYELLMQHPYDFFLQSSTRLFDQFSPRILPISQDFFSLSSHSTIFKQNSKIQLDLTNNRFYIQDQHHQLFVVFGTLKERYKNSDLIHFYNDAKEHHQILMSGAALFSAYSQQTGDQEALWMSSIALILTFVFLLFAFKNIKIFYLSFLILFSLVFGFGISFLFLNEIHILTLVVCVSLVGMILDFSLHFICRYEGIKITKTSIAPMKKLILLGFLISAGGYFLFLFSPLDFLHQIALVSVFSLLGAALFSYFCIPLLLEDSIFQSSSVFETILQRMLICLSFLRKYRIFIYGIMLFLTCFGSLRLYQNYQAENIKSYASMPANLLQDTQEVQRLSGISSPQQILILSNCTLECERDLLEQIKQYTQDYKALSQYFLSYDEQNQVIKAFKDSSHDQKIFEIYSQLGLTDIKHFFDEIQTLKPQHLNDVLKNPLVQSLANLYIDKNKHLVLFYTEIPQQTQSILQNIQEKYHSKIDIFNLMQEINAGFEQIKFNALWLKILGITLAFVILFFFYGFKQSLRSICIILLGASFVLGLFGLFGIEPNLFVIFGLILSSAIGVDYIIFSKHQEIPQILRLKSIFCASFTSLISFFILYFSSTHAVSVFGLSVALNLLVIAILANLEFNKRDEQ